MIARTIVLAVVLVLFGTGASADLCNSWRYVNNVDGTVTDCRTGLIWLYDANCLNSFNGIDKSSGWLIWDDAMKWVKGLQDTGTPSTGCGLSDGSSSGDWRLPTKTEWMAMVASARAYHFYSPALTNGVGTTQWTSGNMFINVPTYYVWSSTNNTAGIWHIDMSDGSMHPTVSWDVSNVWPVRGGQSGTFDTLRLE